MLLLLWIFWNVVCCAGWALLWCCSVLVLSTSGACCSVPADTTALYSMDNTPEFARFISPGYYHSLIFTHFILCISIDILYLKQNSEKGYGPDGQSVILVIGLLTILIFCGFVIHFGCLKTSPEKPDFSKSGVHGGNGPRGSWLNSLCAIWCFYFCVYFGTYVTLWIIFYIPKNRVLKMVRYLHA